MQTSPKSYISAIQPEGICDARPDNAVMLSQVSRELGRMQAIMIVSLFIKELKEWFNVKQNITNEQISMTAEMIVDNKGFYDLSLGNIKSCFRKRMMSEKLYDRLDGNIIIQWLREFKSEMADHCEATSINERKDDTSSAISYEVYLANLKAKAETGDTHSQKVLSDIERRSRIKTPTKESEREQKLKDAEFIKFKHQYLKDKNARNNNAN